VVLVVEVVIGLQSFFMGDRTMREEAVDGTGAANYGSDPDGTFEVIGIILSNLYAESG
jgi:hypothetical protein